MWALDGSARICRDANTLNIEVLTKKYRKVRKNIPVSILSERPVSKETENSNRFELKSLILAQIERWRHA